MSRKQTMSTPYGWCWPISTETGLTLRWLKGGSIETSVALRKHIRITRLPMHYGASERSQLSRGSWPWYCILENGSPFEVPWPHCVAVCGSQVPRSTDTPLYRCPDPKAGVKIMRVNNNIGCYSYVTASLLREYVLWIVFPPEDELDLTLLPSFI